MSRSCLVCGLPLTGALAAAMSVFGVRRSPRNPSLCTRCNAHIEEGRLLELTVLFADLSSFTAMTSRLGAEGTFGVVDAYLREATAVLTRRGAFIDKYVGDCVLAWFNAPVRLPDHPAAAVAAAEELQRKLPEVSKAVGEDLKASVGIATGFARVGRLGSDDAKDYTAIGDVVNQAARLQAQARAGEIVVSERVYPAVAARFPGVGPESLVLKGFKDPSTAYRLNGAPAGPAAASALEGPALTWGGLLSAVFGFGCLGKIFLGSAGLALGAGSGSLLLAAAYWLDASPLRLPALAAASAAAGWSLRRAAAEAKERSALQAKNGCLVPTPGEKRRNLAVFGLATMTLLLVLLELLFHNRLIPRP